MTLNIESLFRNADPIVSEILNNALSEKEISSKDGLELYKTKGIDFHLVGLVADELRKRRVGNIVSYVVNSVLSNVVFVHLVEILEKKKAISYQQKKLYVEQKKLII